MEDKIFDIVTDLIREDISKTEAIDKLLILHSVSGSFSKKDMIESFNGGFNRGFDEGQDQSHSNHTEPEFEEWFSTYCNER